MMASPSSLDCKPHSYSTLLKSINGDHQTEQTLKLEEFLSRLEEERLKIDAFKRELPLCMQLLSNAMETSKEQLQNSRVKQGARPILEEFIPLKNSSSKGSENASITMSDNKATWMTSAQLWNDPNGTNQSSVSSTITSSRELTDHISFNSVSPKLGLDSKQRNGNGAFIPFSKERNLCPNPSLCALPELALASVDKDIQEKKCLESEINGLNCPRREDSVKSDDLSDNQTNSTITGATPTNSQNHRKARRCWSPELHRRFVNALQMLGGSQVATPKQIRELMKVDGLTNDEVKSHLQKYRLHTRRPGPGPQPAGNPTPQLVVLGGIWVPPEYATTAAAAHYSGATATLYGGHPINHASPHYCTQQVPQEFYQAAAPVQQQHQHTIHHQLHMYKPSPQSHSSRGSDHRAGTGDRSESIEDGKSESGGSWKADSGGENGGERKGIVLREDGEESNGSEITLKF